MKIFGIVLIILCCISGIFTNGIGILLAAIAWIPAHVAQNKGKDFWTWYVYAIFLWIVAMIHSVMLKTDRYTVESIKMKNDNLKRCPYCSELIKQEATICPNCRKELTVYTSENKNQNTTYSQENTWKCLKCGCNTNTLNSHYCKVCNAPRFSMETISAEQKNIVIEYINKQLSFNTFAEVISLQNSYFNTSSLEFMKFIVPNAIDFKVLDEYKTKLKEILQTKAKNELSENTTKNENQNKKIEQDNLSNELKKLKNLFENQLITEDEYKTKKAKLLNI